MKGCGGFRVLVPGATLLTKVTLLLSHCLLLHHLFGENGFVNGFSATTTTIVSRGRRSSSSSCSPRFVSSSFSEDDDEGRRRRRSYVVTCVPGLSDELVREIRSVLGPRLAEDAVRREGPSGASFETDDDLDGLRVVYWSRIAHRVMETLASTSDHDVDDEEESLLRDRDDLYDFVRSSVDVRALLGDGRGGLLSLSCRCVSSSGGGGGSSLPEDLRHSHYTALTVKNALVDACREARPDGRRPDVDRDDPDVPLVLSLRRRGRGGGASASLSRVLHAGGASLHRRGHRAGDAVHKAALKESVAAGLLRAAGWDLLAASARDAGEGPAVLLDPTTGGGTLLQEAAYLAADVAPGLLRDALLQSSSTKTTKPPPCLRWKDFAHARDGWNEMRRDALARAERGRRWLRESGDCRLAGNEIHPRALELARRNLDRGGLGGGVVSTTLGDCGDWRPPSNLVVPGRTIIVANPPWGARLNDHDHDDDDDDDHVVDVEETWRSLARFLRREGGGTEAWILSGNKSLTKLLRMRRTRSVPLRTGEQDLRWIQYHVFNDRRSDDDDDDRSDASAVDDVREAPTSAR